MAWNRKLLLVILLVSGMANVAAYAQSPAAQVKQEEAPREIRCNDATFPFLPGEFNYCVAVKMWARKDYRDAEQMLLLAAGWGSKPAQQMLGLAYLNGAGLAMDRPLGLAWLDIASERKSPEYLAISKNARARATAEERERADILFQQLRERYRDDVAALRAKKRFDRELAEISGNPAYQIKLCIVGINSETPDMEGTDPLNNQMCPPVSQSVKILTERAEPYFRGWQGRVDVGPLESVEKPLPTQPNAPITP